MTSPLPLADLTVVEIGHSVAAPFAGLIFAELGAEVVKVENPATGDDARNWGPPFVEGSSALFKTLNRNKRSAAVDMKDPEALARLRAFILERADVVIQNMRPGTIDRYGLGAKSLRADKPALIYCNIGAFGTQGPLAKRPGYDPLMQAFGGIMSVTGEDGRPPVRVGPSMVDQGTGMWGVIGVLAALHRRHATGEGAEIDTCLFETAVGWVAPQIANYLASGKVPRRLGTENANIAPYRAFECADGWLVIAAGNDVLFRRLSEAIGRSDLPGDPRFTSNPKRVENREVLNALIAAIVRGETRATWIDRLDAAGVPCAPMQTVDELVAHPQTIASGLIQPPPVGEHPVTGLPVSFDGERPPYRTRAPELGADTALVLGGQPAGTRAAE